ncbi:MAG: hypothetical protein ACREB3_01040 [Burkholderiales bacterium]
MIRPSVLREVDEHRLGAPKGKPRRPNPELQRLLRVYVQEAGLPPVEKTPEVDWDKSRCRAIAEEFEDLPFADAEDLVEQAYGALALEVRAQFDLLSRHYEFEAYGDGDPVPYAGSGDMMDDVRENKHLFVYSGGDDHAILSREENFMFRAVHDLFGHAANAWSFSPSGEENAWVEHSKAFTPLARAALTTETRGQNSWVNCGPHGALPPAERPYAEQKGALLPEPRWTHPVFEEAYRDEPAFVRLA